MSGNVVTLAEVVVEGGLQTGPFGSQLKANEYTEAGIPVVMPKDIDGGKITTNSIACITSEKSQQLTKHLIKSGDILFPRRGDLGRIAVAQESNEGWICGTGCLRARLAQNAFPDFIHQYLQLDYVVKWLKSNALGQTMLNLNTEIIGALPIDLPSYEEQKSIATALQTWDAAIEKTEALIDTKERQFRWLQSNTIENAKNTTDQRFGNFLRESRLPDTINNPEQRLTVRLHLKGVDIREYRGTEQTDATQYFVRKAGQFIYGKQNIFRGAIGIVPNELDGYTSSQDIPAFDIGKNILSDWLYWYVSRPRFYKKLERFAAGSGSRRLHPKEFLRLHASVPSIDEQRRIANVLNAAQQEIILLKKLVDQYRTQKRGLMQNLLTRGMQQ